MLNHLLLLALFTRPLLHLLPQHLVLPQQLLPRTQRLRQAGHQGLDLLCLLRLLVLQRLPLTLHLPRLHQQALVVAVEPRQFVLLDDQALLQLTHLDLQLLHLRLMAALILLALLTGGGAVMLQRIAGMLVLVFQRLDLLVLVVQAQVQLTYRLIQGGIARLLGLQGTAGRGQLRRLTRQRLGLNLVLLLQGRQRLLDRLQFALQRRLFMVEHVLRRFDTCVALLHQLLGQLTDQVGQGFAHARLVRCQCRLLRVQLLEVAVNRGLGPGVAQLDAYGIDTGVFATGQ